MSPLDRSLRWKQRFQNFEKALAQFRLAKEKSALNTIEEAGLIQMFEFTFELAWKTLKDRLEFEGFEVDTPREVLKQSVQSLGLSNGEVWLDALEKRNLMTHTYDEAKSQEALKLIRENYAPVIETLYLSLKKDL